MDQLPDGVVTAVSRHERYSFSKPRRDEIVLLAGVGIEGDAHAGVTVRHRHRVRVDPTQPNLRQVHLIHGELFDELRAQGYEVEPGQLGENVTTRGIDLLGLPRGTILRFGSPAPTAADPAGDPECAAAPVGHRSAGAAPAAALPPSIGATVAAPGATAPGTLAPRSVRDAVAPVVAAAENASLEAATANAVEALVAAAGRFAEGGTAVVVLGLRNPCQQINKFRPGLLKKVVEQKPDGTVVRKGGVMAVVLSGGPVQPGDRVSVDLPPLPHQPLECV
jgi:MOSC domain-containing protein YiiM